MRVALVHDYLYTYGGAERVLEVLHEIWPDAPVYTAWVDWPWLKKEKPEWLKWQIIPSWFDKMPFKKQLCSPLRFLAPKIWSSFDLSSFDVVISSSAWYMCKGVSLYKLKTHPPAGGSNVKTLSQNLKLNKLNLISHQPSVISHKPLHICYCHTPPRYLYGYPTALNFGRFWWGKFYATLVNPFLRIYDFKSSETIDRFICNSKEVQKRIEKFYRRQAEIIYPPIFTPRGAPRVPACRTGRQPYFGADSLQRKYLLMVNRLVGPKNVALAIKACQKLGLNLKIVGTGPDEKQLKKLAEGNPKIEFLGYVDDQKLANLYYHCEAVLYLAQQEDFGLTPVEAMSFGKPVVAYKSGGVRESVIEGKTGLFIDKLELGALIKCLKSLKFKKFKPQDFLLQAEKFTKERFKNKIKTFVEEKLRK